ncbi:MAG: efflux RND transporter periplasmic adaptor subunit [Chthoniobacterales bacterium]
MNNSNSSSNTAKQPTQFPFLQVALILLTIFLVIGGFWFFNKKKTGATSEKNSANASEKTQYWISGMHPWIIMPEPGQCPICGMDLVPLDPNKFRGEISINPNITQNIGIQTTPVIEGPLIKTTRTVGIVSYDEEGERDVNTKFSGWIESISVDTLGAPVKAGDILFSIYSPELYSAQEDYLIARKSGNKALIEASRKRLQNFDITAKQIEELVARGKPLKSIPILSPFNGIVTAKHATEGMRVDPGMQTYRIADISKVWVLATVYEYQLPYLQEGQNATMTLSYIAGQTFSGHISYIYPYLDSKTREAQVRIDFDNSAGILKPGMFANVELHNHLAAEATLAPRSAVIDTGIRKVAFVSLGKGSFEPREVQTGITTDLGLVQILSGLSPGEKVVTSGQFLLDSEANMREAIAKMVEKNSLPTAEKAEKNGHDADSSKQYPALSESVNKDFDSALTAYFKIQNTLAADEMTSVSETAKTLASALEKMASSSPFDSADAKAAYTKSLGDSMTASYQLTDAKDIAAARLILGRLSLSLRDFARGVGIPMSFSDTVMEVHCPMALEDQGGATWLQREGPIRNPYMGDRMLECYDEKSELPVNHNHSTPAASK